ncbi:hypothetical protein HGRIS_009550 [Hohenbuehelia grisea]|uniref:Uncharacterized protein n=1 Tax=Hohenbuehelia grisea TaxID=104357 RepID=A0ABR3J1X4_9AGAR
MAAPTSPSGAPTTPVSGMRNRANPTSQHVAGEYIPDDPSPTLSSASASPDGGNGFAPHHLNDPIARTTAFRAAQIQPATRKVTMRSDPVLLTSFDPIAEKELYELWAPKR